MAASAKATMAIVYQPCQFIGAAPYRDRPLPARVAGGRCVSPPIGFTLAAVRDRAAPTPTPFSEKGFYLQEFRGRTLALCAPSAALAAPAPLRELLAELGANETRSVVLAAEAAGLEGLGLGAVLPGGTEGLEGDVWRGLRGAHAVGLVVGAERPFAAGCRELALRLGVAKLVWIEPEGGLVRPDGRRASFVDLAELRALVADAAHPRAPLLREIQALLEAGVASVNVCTLEGVADELFTYAGSGTLFTRERYLEVRRLSIDDYDAAWDLVARGVEEGYLAPRAPREVDRVLAGGFGAFVEGRHLAGIGTLLVYPEERGGEIASLYTLTRFLGEGVGTHLVAHARERAAALGLRRIFACTTHERVGAFFERQGFARARPEDLPEARWKNYDADRRARLLCYRLELDPLP
jgi:amino-acid N-acetyltransferase